MLGCLFYFLKCLLILIDEFFNFKTGALVVDCMKVLYFLTQGEICTQPPELDVQLEVERLTIQEFADELQKVQSSQLNLYEPTPPNSNESRETQATADSKQPTRKTKRLK